MSRFAAFVYALTAMTLVGAVVTGAWLVLRYWPTVDVRAGVEPEVILPRLWQRLHAAFAFATVLGMVPLLMLSRRRARVGLAGLFTVFIAAALYTGYNFPRGELSVVLINEGARAARAQTTARLPVVTRKHEALVEQAQGALTRFHVVHGWVLPLGAALTLAAGAWSARRRRK